MININTKSWLINQLQNEISISKIHFKLSLISKLNHDNIFDVYYNVISKTYSTIPAINKTIKLLADVTINNIESKVKNAILYKIREYTELNLKKDKKISYEQIYFDNLSNGNEILSDVNFKKVLVISKRMYYKNIKYYNINNISYESISEVIFNSKNNQDKLYTIEAILKIVQEKYLTKEIKDLLLQTLCTIKNDMLLKKWHIFSECLDHNKIYYNGLINTSTYSKQEKNMILYLLNWRNNCPIDISYANKAYMDFDEIFIHNMLKFFKIYKKNVQIIAKIPAYIDGNLIEFVHNLPNKTYQNFDQKKYFDNHIKIKKA